MATTHLSPRDAFGHWLAGFTTGEGSFNLHVGCEGPRSQFCIKLRADELPILQDVCAYWDNIGSLTLHKGRPGSPNPGAVYSLGGIHPLAETVFPHFHAYPLRNRKARDFRLWALGVRLHYAVALRTLPSRGYNQGHFPRWQEKDVALFGRLAQSLRDVRVFREVDGSMAAPTDDPAFAHWLAGFIAAEGCLGLRITKTGYRQARFSLRLRADDTPTLLGIKQFFGGGSVRREESKGHHPTACYELTTLDIVQHRFIPFLQSFPLRAKKALEVPHWIAAAELCYQVGQRPVVTLGSGHCGWRGRQSAWLPADIELFRYHLEAVAALRRFKMPE